MKKLIDLTGKIFGRLTVIEQIGNKNGEAFWACVCQCGGVKNVRSSSLRKGLTRSCGCLSRENSARVGATYGPINGSRIKHGHAPEGPRSPTYRSWASMKARCENQRSTAYRRYGARGIRVCERWQSFENFLKDMGERPDGTSIDRYPNRKGNYEPGNCRWATRKQQRANQDKYDAKATAARGVNQGSSKLCDLDVWLIRNIDASQQKIADFFGVSQANVSKIRRRAAWTHVV